MNCAVKSSAVPKVTQSRHFNCTKPTDFPQHTLDITAQLLTVQLETEGKTERVCGGGLTVCSILGGTLLEVDRSYSALVT